MFDLHCRYGPREVMELLTEMQTINADVGGPSSSAGGPADVIPCSPIHFAAPGAAMQSELNSDKDSDEDFFDDTDDSSESSDGTEFVLESQCRRDFLLTAPAPIPDLSSVSSHFHTLHLHDMGEEPMEGFGGGGDDYDVAGGEEFRVGHRFSTREAVQMAVKNYIGKGNDKHSRKILGVGIASSGVGYCSDTMRCCGQELFVVTVYQAPGSLVLVELLN
ncbi:hypothetical protein PIB30_054290 [Stylosanthes scabra]|uniref:Uncharacterized protein n=1 Tax=Stylosanthes scabra TaxID=79078 RepID=A0ABU6XJC8_9FABA|nr:hypothetical protein [Stylosanthes scabra]